MITKREESSEMNKKVFSIRAMAADSCVCRTPLFQHDRSSAQAQVGLFHIDSRPVPYYLVGGDCLLFVVVLLQLLQ